MTWIKHSLLVLIQIISNCIVNLVFLDIAGMLSTIQQLANMSCVQSNRVERLSRVQRFLSII